MTTIQIVDDSDPAVRYSSGWQKAGGSNEYNLTTSWTNQPGTTATFTFVGIQISVVGTVGPRTPGYVSPQSNYTVDGSSSNVYAADQDPSTVRYNTRFYLSPTLPYGQHTLIVTNLLNSDSLFIDYFLVSKSSTFSPTVVTVTSTTTAGSANQTSANIGLSNSNTGAIVGSTLGAALLIIVAVAFLLWIRRRNKRNTETQIIPRFRDDLQESVPALSYTQFSNGGTPTTPRPAFPSETPSDTAQPYGTGIQQAPNQIYGALPPPPVYTPDVSQPLNSVHGTSSGNLHSSKLILSYNTGSGNTS